jgi:hypothetical protein
MAMQFPTHGQTLTHYLLYRLVLLAFCSCAFAVRRMVELLTSKLPRETFHSNLPCKTDQCLRNISTLVSLRKFCSIMPVNRRARVHTMAKALLNSISAQPMARMDFLLPLVPSLATPLHHTAWVPPNLLTLMEPPSLANLMLQMFLILPFNQASLMRMIKDF